MRPHLKNRRRSSTGCYGEESCRISSVRSTPTEAAALKLASRHGGPVVCASLRTTEGSDRRGADPAARCGVAGSLGRQRDPRLAITELRRPRRAFPGAPTATAGHHRTGTDRGKACHCVFSSVPCREILFGDPVATQFADDQFAQRVVQIAGIVGAAHRLLACIAGILKGLLFEHFLGTRRRSYLACAGRSQTAGGRRATAHREAVRCAMPDRRRPVLRPTSSLRSNGPTLRRMQ